ncbi:MAG: DUF4145 domain-containing protein [Phycisphaeraceae bacterium]|nr:DUF4145 domain-containing protein [Phycisphaeraceae bacterium]
MMRSLIMHVAVDRGAKENQVFASYVEYLNTNRYVPPTVTEYLDRVRLLGNRAAHDIDPVDPEEVEKLLAFVEVLLRLIYDFPSRLAIPPVTT